MNLGYRIVNVFTVGDDPFSGNPLAVFADGAHLTDDQMQGLARQMNLSETTFVVRRDEDGADADVRIFTPAHEMPFAGHPTLGTAYVVSSLFGDGGTVVLRMPAGRVPVSHNGSHWVLTTAVAPSTAPVAASRAELAAAVGLAVGDLADVDALWVDTGTEQLILPVRSPEAVRAAEPDVRLLRGLGEARALSTLVDVWAPTGETTVEARVFYVQGSSVVEDPATGSALANLGGWYHHHGERGISRTIRQGAAVDRPSELFLEVDALGAIRVGGAVHEIGAGVLVI
ncbi:MAG: PhzF family phenazine biosynthesis protein [Actinomycetota bacterium]|nr:PhzF family phenazine biosynthesis protein [Actinomycetota bacterium]